MSQLFQEHGDKATGQKVCIATTSYDSPDGSYTFSMAKSREALHKAGIQTAYYLLQGNCHVDDARNLLIKEFLDSDCTELVFIDSDVSWQESDLVALCKHDVDVVGGVYPFRRADVKDNMPVRMMEGISKPDDRGLIEVEGLPSGFMRIKRRVIERLFLDANKHFGKDKEKPIGILFERAFDNGVRWGGDLHFCNKVRDYGFRIYADYEMVLGHVGKHIIKEGLGSALRRQAGVTLSHIAGLVRDGKENIKHFTEVRNYVGNTYGALEDVLAMAVIMARKADGPIIETGSGLTTILMAAANPNQTIFCLEHSKLYAQKLREMAIEAGVNNIGLCVCPIKDGWYDLSGMDLPGHFALGLNDGPPRTIGSRKGFYERFGHKVDTIIADDTEDQSYREWVSEWCSDNGRSVDFIERSALIRYPEKELVNEA